MHGPAEPRERGGKIVESEVAHGVIGGKEGVSCSSSRSFKLELVRVFIVGAFAEERKQAHGLHMFILVRGEGDVGGKRHERLGLRLSSHAYQCDMVASGLTSGLKLSFILFALNSFNIWYTSS
jgi:hypothetical protein